MKITFSPAELDWLSSLVKNMIVVQKNYPNAPGLGSLASMKYKFTPNSLVTYLKRSERELLLGAVNYRADSLHGLEQTSAEFELLMSLKAKLQ